MVRDYCGFVDTIAWQTTGNRVCGASVDAEFVVKDRSQYVASSKGIPVTVDDVS